MSNILTSAEGSNRALGFTLIEILMVLVLVSILVAVAVPQFMDFGNEAKRAVTRDRMNSLKQAIVGDARAVSSGSSVKLGYEINCTGLPSSLIDLVVQPTTGNCASAYDPFTKRGWRGPYVSASESTWNQDAWGTALQFFSVGPPARTLRSCGIDKICGNADDLTLSY